MHPEFREGAINERAGHCEAARPGSAGGALRDDPRPAPPAAFRRGPDAGRALTAEAAGIFLDYSKNRVTDETLKLLLQLARGVGPAGSHRRHVPRREDQRHRGPGRAARGPARAARGVDHRDGEDVVPEVHAVLDKMAALRRSGARRRLEGAYRQADPQRRSTSASAARTSARSWPMRR